MEDRIRNPSAASSSLSCPTPHEHEWGRRRRGGDAASCSGKKKCQSCTAGVIADCVAVCCCPCAVVNIITLAFFKLPWAVARRLVRGMRKKSRRRRRNLEAKKGVCGGGGDVEGAAETGPSEIVLSVGGEENLNYDFSAVFGEEDVWLELYEVGHLGFGRVSFTGNTGSD